MDGMRIKRLRQIDCGCVQSDYKTLFRILRSKRRLLVFMRRTELIPGCTLIHDIRTHCVAVDRERTNVGGLPILAPVLDR